MRLWLILLTAYAQSTTIVVKRYGVYQWRSNSNGYTIGVPLDAQCTRDTYVNVALMKDLEGSGLVDVADVDITAGEFTTATIAYVNGGCKLVQQLDDDDVDVPDLDELVGPYGFSQPPIPKSAKQAEYFYLYVVIGLVCVGGLIVLCLRTRMRSHREGGTA